MNKRLLAVLLCLVLVVGLMPFGAFAASEADTAYTATTTGSAAAADVTSYLAFSSDVHNSNNNQSANRLNTWINNVYAKTGKNIDVMSFCGDNGSASAGESDFWTYTQSVMNAVNNNSHVNSSVFTTGNHEHMNGNFNSTSNNVAKSFKRIGEAKNAADYIIYAFGPKDWAGNRDQFYSDDLSTLDSYLGGLSSADRQKPIFILSHFPAHSFSGGSSMWGGSRSTQNADQLISTLNKYGNQGYDIYFLWGHNHTVSDTHYDEVFKGSLDGTAISFTYLAAGCMSDSEYGTGSAFVKGKGLLVGINNKEVVSIQYFDANGNDVTEQGGSATPTSQPTTQPTTAPSGTTPVSGKQYIIVCDGHALTTAAGESYSNNGSGSGSYNYTGLAGKSYSSGMTVTSDMVWTFTSSGSGFVISNNGKYLNGYYASNSSGGSNGDLKLESSQVDVWTLSGNTLKSTNGSSGASSDKFLAYGNGSQSNPNTFSVRSAPNANNSNVVNTLTFIEVSNGQVVEPTAQPTTTPSGTTSSVSVTPTTDNPSASATINVGDTLTINVTNGSSQNAYDFSASVANTSVAQLQGNSTVNIGMGNTAAFTVKGLAVGTTDITIQNSNQYGSQYTRKAVIHLTVVSGGVTPTTQPTTQPGTDTQVAVTPTSSNPEASATIKVGDTLSIRVTNGSEHDASYTFTASLGNSGVAQLQTSSTSSLSPNASGTITVKGLAAGTVDITVTNNNTEYGAEYERKATIHLTVVSGTTPTVEPTAEPTTTPVPSCTHPQTAVSGKKAATCTEAGYTGDTVCLKCGEIVAKGEVIPAKGHETVLQGKKDATCTEAGYTGDYVCTVCGEVVAKGSEIAALGHDTVLRNAKAATCEADGYTGDEVCKVCGETVKKGEVIKATGHDWDDGTITKAATCTEDGVMTFVCKTDASHTKTEVIPAAGHTWGEWVQTKAPTETEEGVETRTCSVCGATETRAIPVLTHVHQLVAVAEVPADCENAGTEAYWKCSGCGRLFSDAEGKNEIEAPVAIAAKGHTLVAVPEVPATEDKDGTEAYWKCEVCGKLFSDAEGKNEIAAPVVIPATGHKACDGGANCPSIKLADVDRTAKSWYHHAVDWAYVKGVVKGVSETAFGPQEPCTREQMVTFLWRMNGSPEPKSMVSPFADVTDPGYYSYKAILWAAENGVTNGTDAVKKLFSPKDNVTREQVVTLLWRLAGSEKVEGDMQFTDVAAGRYSYEAVKWAVKEGVTTGRSTTSFAPAENCTRAEIVTFLWRSVGEPLV